MCFGGCQYGIHGSVPGEIVHALQLGIMPRVIDGLFCTKALTADQQKAESKAKSKHSAIVEAPESLIEIAAEPPQKTATTKDIIKRGAFGGQAGREVDYISKLLGREGQHQSDRDMPPLNFSNGITNRAKTTASEQQGIMFLTHLILCSTFALKKGCIMDRMSSEKLEGYVIIMENLLCFEELLKTTRTSGIKRSDLPAITYFVCVLLDTIKIVVSRETGDRMDLIKFHLIVHMVTDDVPRYASPANISGSAGECQFKDNFKLPASTGQLRHTSFDHQLYMRRYQHMLIHRCAQRVRRGQARAERRSNSSSTGESKIDETGGVSELATQIYSFGKKIDESGDRAEHRRDDGLSSTVYRV